ncbi:MAG: hypothetical protein ABS43_01655 [Bordetella sp. SCN 67-23]|nr:hypothetical protein [Burkholderiales bacterium]ODS76277.1 MAG: hypothetical protein ABS43_01655 [Bordetella sp. SCN 67-23]OJW90080.1 MAG: hypothetical protein BGO71_27590 [Burkholderiales bacterium 67-32]
MRNVTSSDVLEALGTSARSADDIARQLGGDVEKVRKTLSNLYQRAKVTPAGMADGFRLYRAVSAGTPPDTPRPIPAATVPATPDTHASAASDDEWSIGVLVDGRIFVNHGTAANIFDPEPSATVARMLQAGGGTA